MFDTQTVVKVAITAVGDSRTGQIENTLGPVQFANTGKIQNSINGIEWLNKNYFELILKSKFFRYGETTAVGGGITEGASQMNTNDNVSDMMIVITDGFDGDLTALQE